MDDLTRRGFLAGTAGTAAIVATAGNTADAQTISRRAPVAHHLPEPGKSGIDHIVVAMMENRSFDHYLGWLPGADGRQAGLSFQDKNGVTHPTHHLTAPHGCGFHDPDHSYGGGRIEYNDGKCDGWLRAGANDDLSIGYYQSADLGFYGRAARDWTVCDRYFAAVLGPTFPNRFFQNAGQTDRTSNTLTISQVPTIWDRLKAKKLTGRYYFSDVPFTALWGAKHLDITRHISSFYDDAKHGKLPSVSFVDPRLLGGEIGLSEDEHPLSDIRLGQHFLGKVYEAVTTSPNWERTALVINYDEWGGFYDHVAPPVGPDPRPDLGTGLRGFRVPCLLISPRARRKAIAHEVYDHTSVLKMIEWRFGLAPLTVRDAAARNLAEVLDFTGKPNLKAPKYNVPAPVTFGCLDPNTTHTYNEDWARLRDTAAKFRFPVA
jgi:phospholipase C